jgi:hypothetical protein
MTISFRNKIFAAFLFSVLALLFTGCASRQAATQNLVMTEYFLDKAGFQQWPVNDTTPKRQALLQSIPRATITTFKRDGQTYHAYTDEAAQRLYVGDEAAYQKYLSITQGRKLCQRVVAPDSSQFWSCYDEYQDLTGGRPRGQ